MNRRDIIVGVGALGLAQGVVAAAGKPRRMKPQPGDVLAHAFGEHAGTPLVTRDVGDERLFAFPMAPASRLLRDGSLHNQLAVVRVNETALSDDARRYAAENEDGAFLVYSAACTHTGCEVSGWHGEARRLVCPCHGSEFDIHDAARVVNGPAPKPLAMLKVALADGAFHVTGGFSRRVGPAPP